MYVFFYFRQLIFNQASINCTVSNSNSFCPEGHERKRGGDEREPHIFSQIHSRTRSLPDLFMDRGHNKLIEVCEQNNRLPYLGRVIDTNTFNLCVSNKQRNMYDVIHAICVGICAAQGGAWWAVLCDLLRGDALRGRSNAQQSRNRKPQKTPEASVFSMDALWWSWTLSGP